MAEIEVDRDGAVLVVSLNRLEVRNAVDGPTARALAETFRDYDADPELSVAVLTGKGGSFCAGADLGTIAEGSDAERTLRVAEDGDGPLGVTRMTLGKPVLAAVEGYAVAGGLELALWCDLRVASTSAIFGVYCRRWGVPLVDGGTIRLPRLVGHGRALDMILTGRDVTGEEGLRIGLVDRVVEERQALPAAVALAKELAALPQTCLRSDRLSAFQQWGMKLPEALRNEYRHGIATIGSGETLAGAQRFRQRAREA
jgi:enoyl-CoA hydratase